MSVSSHLLATRRGIAVGVVAATLSLFVGTSLAAENPAPKAVPTNDLMAKQALPDIVQGNADAPVTMIEYASMTCTHCAHFHKTTYPTLVKNYVDTGKVKFILREFPLDPIATAAFMLARCSGPDKRTAVVDLLFDTQDSWAFVDQPLEALEGIMKQTGMGKDKFEACLADKTLRDQITAVSKVGFEKFGVNATPTFFVNGTKVTGELNPDTLAKTLDPLVNKKS